MIRIENVSYQYTDGSIGLENINLDLPETGIVLIRGSNGEGKSTLLNLIANLIAPTKGNIYFNGKDIITIKNFTRDKIGYIPQQYMLFSELSVEENLNYFNDKASSNFSEDFQITNLLKKRIFQISGGEARRVSIVRALNKNVPVLLCDEITESLDKENIQIIMSEIKKVSNNILVLIVSHDNSLCKYANRIIEIRNHTVYKDEVINEYKNKPIFHNQEKSLKIGKIWLLALKHLKEYRIISIVSLLITSVILAILIFSFSAISIDLNRVLVNEMVENGKYRVNVFANDYEVVSKVTTTPLTYVFKNYTSIRIGEFVDNMYCSINSTAPYLAVLNDESILNKEKVIGNIPKNKNEIIISEYLYNIASDYGIYDNNNQILLPKEYYDLIGKSILYDNKEVKITGILKDDSKKYEWLKDIDSPNAKQMPLIEFFNNDVIANNYIYVTKEFCDELECEVNDIHNVYIESDNPEELIDLFREYNRNGSIDIVFYYTSLEKKLETMVEILKKVFMFISILFLFLALIIIYNYFGNSINHYENNHYVFKYMGVSEKKICSVYLFEFLIIFLFASFVGLGIGGFFTNIVNELVSLNAYTHIAFLNLDKDIFISVFFINLVLIHIVYLIYFFRIRTQIKNHFE